MGMNLHTAQVYQIEYSNTISSGYESYDVFRRIFIDTKIDLNDDKESYSFTVQRQKQTPCGTVCKMIP